MRTAGHGGTEIRRGVLVKKDGGKTHPPPYTCLPACAGETTQTIRYFYLLLFFAFFFATFLFFATVLPPCRRVHEDLLLLKTRPACIHGRERSFFTFLVIRPRVLLMLNIPLTAATNCVNNKIVPYHAKFARTFFAPSRALICSITSRGSSVTLMSFMSSGETKPYCECIV
jgi:hypothetical protein